MTVRIWHAFGLQPHRVENFKVSKDPQFVEKVWDFGLYLNPWVARSHCVWMRRVRCRR